MKRQWKIAAQVALLASLGAWLTGCSGGSAPPPLPVPKIQNINSSTTPTSPLGLPIEINGSGFQASPGKVHFVQGSTALDVVPAAAAWSDTGIVAIVPATLTAPGTVSVTVITSGGTSNAVTVNLVAAVTFNPSGMGWGTTTALPKAMTGLRAIGVPGSTSTSAYVVVTGGYDGTANTTTVLTNTLNADGTVGATWSSAANPLPATRAHHALAEADDTNSLVTAGSRYLYVIGGQQTSTDAPGGTNTVYIASVTASSGAIGTWTASPNNLPQALVGTTATVHNGYLYVAGGLAAGNNVPTTAVYSAPVNSDGTIGAWTTFTGANTLPTARAFGSMFVFGGVIYYIDGDPNNSSAPNTQGVGDKNVYFASAVRGSIGTWQVNANSTIHDRAKGVLFTAYGQVIAAEGVYTGAVGSGEMETSTINGANTSNVALNPWGGLTGVTIPSANVYNASGFTSPLVTTTFSPRFLILGGQAQTGTTGAGGALSSVVYYNNKPL